MVEGPNGPGFAPATSSPRSAEHRPPTPPRRPSRWPPPSPATRSPSRSAATARTAASRSPSANCRAANPGGSHVQPHVPALRAQVPRPVAPRPAYPRGPRPTGRQTRRPGGRGPRPGAAQSPSPGPRPATAAGRTRQLGRNRPARPQPDARPGRLSTAPHRDRHRQTTPVEHVTDLLTEVDMLLLMTVEPGFGGQPFLDIVLPKLRRARALIGGRDAAVWLQVDGGGSEGTPERRAAAGARG